MAYTLKRSSSEEIDLRNKAQDSLISDGVITDVNVLAALKTLEGDKLEATSYTAADILSKIKNVDGSGSGLDADTIDGYATSITGTASTVAIRDASGNLTAADTFNYGSAAYTKYNSTTKTIDFIFV